jgi:hypothetical protein
LYSSGPGNSAIAWRLRVAARSAAACASGVLGFEIGANFGFSNPGFEAGAAACATLASMHISRANPHNTCQAG